MDTLKQEAIASIESLPDSVEIDDIMYQLYVLDKVRKGRESLEKEETISIKKLKGEVHEW